MIERDGPVSLSRQCALLGVSRSSRYYRPKGESAENLALMRRMDELHMAYPFYGSRQLMRVKSCASAAAWAMSLRQRRDAGNTSARAADRRTSTAFDSRLAKETRMSHARIVLIDLSRPSAKRPMFAGVRERSGGSMSVLFRSCPFNLSALAPAAGTLLARHRRRVMTTEYDA